MAEAPRFARNYVFLALSRAVLIGGNAVILLIIGWGLSVEDFGRFTFALSLAGLLSIMVAMGIDQWVVAYLPKQMEKGPAYAGGALTLRGALIIPFELLLLCICICSSFDWEQSMLVMLLGLAMGLQIVTSLSTALAQAIERTELGLYTNIVRNAFMVASVVIWMLLLRGSVVWLAALWAAAQMPAVLVGIYVIGRKGCGIHWEAGIRPWWAIVRKAYVFAIVSFVLSSAGAIEAVLLKYLLWDDQQVGYFQMSVRLSLALGVPVSTLAQAFYPILSRRSAESRESLARAVHLYHKFQLLIAALVFLLGVVFPREILYLLFRERYLAATEVFRLLMLACLIAHAPPAWDVFHVTGLERYCFWILLVETVLTFGLNLVVIPLFGMLGTACVRVGLSCVTRLITLWVMRKTRYPLAESWRPYLKMAFCFLIVVGAAWVVATVTGIMPAIATYFVVGLPLIYIIVLDSSEKAMVRDLYHRVWGKLRGH